jgi:orotidine-5'-phosphate decarboxylase
MNFIDRLNTVWEQTQSALCVGLDPDPARFPLCLKGHEPDQALFAFCTAIVDATAPFACAFKPQIAYFAALRAEPVLESLIAWIQTHHPDRPVILDAKRGDIGSTATLYAREAFERYKADAVTVNPYMGYDSIAPWLEWTDKGVFLLCRTSNPSGAELQGLLTPAGHTVFEEVALKAAGPWNRSGQLGLVVGATYPAEMARVRALAPELPLLVPGVGAQGGDIEATVKAGRTTKGQGLLINSSRAILYASSGEDFATAAGEVAAQTAKHIAQAQELCQQ